MDFFVCNLVQLKPHWTLFKGKTVGWFSLIYIIFNDFS